MKKYIKRMLILLKWTTITLLGAVALLFLVSWLLMFLTTSEKEKGEKTDKIYLTTNGVHTDFIIPKKFLPQEHLIQLEIEENDQFVAYGWGDKGFYLDTPEWKDLKFSTAFRAVCLPSPTAMHITRFQQSKERWKPIYISQQQRTELFEYINTGFQQDEQGNFMLIKKKVYDQYDAFYEGMGSYSFFKSCNEWVNIGLKKIGRKTALWSPLDWGIFYHLEEEKRE